MSSRQVRTYHARGMPSNLEDPTIVAKCKRWKANNIDSHRGGWSSRGARHDANESTSGLLELRIKKLLAEAELLRITNDQQETSLLLRDVYIDCTCAQTLSMFEMFDRLVEIVYAKYVELEGRENESAKEAIQQQIDFAKRRLLHNELIGTPIGDLLEDYKERMNDAEQQADN